MPPFGWKEAFRRVGVCQLSTSGSGEGRNGEWGAVDQIPVLLKVAAVWMCCIVTCHPTLKAQILLGLWKLSLILK